MDIKRKHAETGFTLLEVMTVLGIIFFMAAMATPVALSWIPNYRLKNAALDLFSNFQLARMRAIQSSSEYGIVFHVRAGKYQLVNGGKNRKFEAGDPSSDDIVEKTVTLSEYGGGVRYGFGCAKKKAIVSGGGFQAGDEISYRDDTAEFNSQGMSNRMGYVYLENSQKSAYAISTPTIAGVVSIKKWSGRDWQ
jgi:type II secretory pathway pseudopilin PulG